MATRCCPDVAHCCPLRVQFWRPLGMEAWPPVAQKGRDMRMEEIDLGYLCKTFSYEGLGEIFLKYTYKLL